MFTDFQPIVQRYEQITAQSISAINPAVTENTISSIVKAHVQVINQNSGCVTQSQSITRLRFISSYFELPQIITWAAVE